MLLGTMRFDARACEVGRQQYIADRDDEANRNAAKRKVHEHYLRVKRVLEEIILEGAHPFRMADVALRAIREGLPVHPTALFAPENVIAQEARRMALAIFPRGTRVHTEARDWLAAKLRKPPERIEGDIAWNFVTGGEVVNRSGE